MKVKAIWTSTVPTKDGLYWGLEKRDKTETPTTLLRDCSGPNDHLPWRSFYDDNLMTEEEVGKAYWFGPAIPLPDVCQFVQDRSALREEFAARAMEALIVSRATYYNEFDLHKEAVYHADALLVELAKPKPQPPIQEEGWSTLPTHWLIVNKRLYVVGMSSISEEMAWKTAFKLMRGQMSEGVLRKECRCVRAEITVQGLPA